MSSNSMRDASLTQVDVASIPSPRHATDADGTPSGWQPTNRVLP